MKRILSLLLCLVMGLTLLPAVPAFAASELAIDETNFPDGQMRVYVMNFDKDRNGSLSAAEIKDAKELDIFSFGGDKVKTLKGVELLPELTKLYANDGELTEVDLSSNTKLQVLQLMNNQLTELDLSHNPALTLVSCSSNRLTKLDLSKNTRLETLWCGGNPIGTLDVSAQPKLKSLICGGCGLKKLDLSHNPELETLDCENNALTKLDLSQNTKLHDLFCHDNALTKLDIINCPTLIDVVRNSEHVTLYPYDDTKWYFQNENGRLMADKSARLIYYPNVEITAQPSDVTAEDGSTVTFRVATDSSFALYQWYYRKTPTGAWYKCTGDSATTAELKVTAKLSRSGYQYRCKVWLERSDYTRSDPVTLTVVQTQPPVITKQPKDVGIQSGQTATFRVTASGSNLSYQWYYRKSETGAWNKCSDGASATLSVEAKAYRDGYQYRCKVTNAVGSTYSEPATLRAGDVPVITVQPTDTTVGLYKKATLTVAAEGEGLSYQWFYCDISNWPSLNDPIPWRKCSGEGFDTPTLTVKGNRYTDERRYCCKISNAYGKVYTETVSLTVMPKPYAELEEYYFEVPVGEVVNIQVYSKNVDSYQWYYRKTPTGSWIKCTGESAVTDTLIVEAKLYRNGYQYRCKVTNISGSTYSSAASFLVYKE